MSKVAKRTIIIIAAVTVVLIAFVFVSKDENSKLHSAYKVVSYPIVAIQRGCTLGYKSLKGRIELMFNYDEIKDRMDELQNQNDELNYLEQENIGLENQNEQLRSLLKLKNTSDGYDLISANVIAEDITDWYNTFTIDCGSQDGISIGCPVVTAKGLVGIVSSVGLNSSKIRTLPDENNIIMARIMRSNEIVRVSGMSDESMNFTMKVDRISNVADIYIGDVLITASSGDVYPEGLVIGVVTYVDNTEDEKYAYVQPTVNFRDISEVMVIVESN